MKIKLTNITDALIIKEFAVINQGFFPDWEFVLDGEDLEFKPDLPVETARYDYLRSYLAFLEKVTKQKQPWGLLNRVRPVKLVHKLKKQNLDEAQIYDELQKKYLTSSEKLNLLLNVANQQLKVIPDLYHLEKAVSIYIGIPFCPTKCTYCTFATYADAKSKEWLPVVLRSLLAEITMIGSYLKAKNIKITSIYLGGGTPTILDCDQLHLLLTTIYKSIATATEIREITVEAGRPDTITREKLQLLKSFGINRLSINPQSFNQKTLDIIDRQHCVADVISKFTMAKELGMTNINMDLIIGLPGEAVADLTNSLAQVKELAPESLTVHMLAFKRQSRLSNERALYPIASKTALKDMAQLTYAFAQQAEYAPYYLYRQKRLAGNMENIGYAKAGCECVYNILMMEEAQNILGLGVGASSKFLIGESVHNPKDLRTYVKSYPEYAKKKIELLELTFRTGAQSFKNGGQLMNKTMLTGNEMIENREHKVIKLQA